MLQKISDLLNEVDSFSVKNPEELEIFRLKYLSKKGCSLICLRILRISLLQKKKR